MRTSLLALALLLGSLPLAGKGVQRVILQLKWTHQWQFAGYYAAQAQGFYRQAGLDVEILEARPGETPVDAVFHGRADFGIATSDLLVRRAQGQPVVSLAAIFQHSPQAIMVLDKVDLPDLRSLMGKRLALEPHAEELLALLAQQGVDRKDLKIERHAMNLEALIAGEVEATTVYTTTEPFFMNQRGIPYRLFRPSPSDFDFYGDVLFTLEQTLRDHPERVEAFRRASLQGWTWAFAHPEATLRLVHERSRGRASLEQLRFEAEEMRHLVLPDLVEIGYQRTQRWQRIGEVYRSLGLLDQVPSLTAFVYQPPSSARSPRLPWILCATLVLVGGVLVFTRRRGPGPRGTSPAARSVARRLALLDHAQIGLACHAHGRIQEANAAFAGLCGRPLEALPGLEWHQLVSPEALPALQVFLRASREATLPVEFLDPEGTPHPVTLHALGEVRGVRMVEVRPG